MPKLDDRTSWLQSTFVKSPGTPNVNAAALLTWPVRKKPPEKVPNGPATGSLMIPVQRPAGDWNMLPKSKLNNMRQGARNAMPYVMVPRIGGQAGLETGDDDDLDDLGTEDEFDDTEKPSEKKKSGSKSGGQKRKQSAFGGSFKNAPDERDKERVRAEREARHARRNGAGPKKKGGGLDGEDEEEVAR